MLNLSSKRMFNTLETLLLKNKIAQEKTSNQKNDLV